MKQNNFLYVSNQSLYRWKLLKKPWKWRILCSTSKFKDGKKISEVSLVGNQPDTTNNRMEMMAILKAVIFLNLKEISNSDIEFYSDSNLVISTLTKGWKRKPTLISGKRLIWL